MIRFILTIILLFTSLSAKAVVPDPVTWLFHAVGGYAIAYVMDKHMSTSDGTGIVTATVVGAVKEVSDLNFSVPDFLSWGAGALFYHRTKNMVRCPDRDDIIVYYEDTLEECVK